MPKYVCEVCDYICDEGTPWEQLDEGWVCPVCGSDRTCFILTGDDDDTGSEASTGADDRETTKPEMEKYRRTSDDVETGMADIHAIAESGKSITEPMRSRRARQVWDSLLIRGAQLAKIPLNADEPVNTRTVIGPGAKHPLVIETPIYVTHMSFGALSREVKQALATGSGRVQTAMCSGEGGILPASIDAAHKYIFEYVPNQYSVTEENLRRVDAIEIKIGQSAKPGVGGHLPGEKVTEEVAAIRGRTPGESITSSARYDDIRTPDELREKVRWLRDMSGGKPIGIKLAAGDVEADLRIALIADPDFVTIDGRPGATASAPKVVKDSTSIPTVFALCRARKLLDAEGADNVSLVITGGLRTSADFAKALALGADAVAIGTAALMACGCQQYRVCHTGRCPMGIATQDPELRARFDVEQSAQWLENYLRVSTEELAMFARLTGNDDVHGLSISDLCTTDSEVSGNTDIAHA
jgi:methylamine---glutamate N-methyltransferase subunit C